LGLLHIWLAEGVAKILCCAKLVFMLFTISPQHRGLKHYSVLLGKWLFKNGIN